MTDKNKTITIRLSEELHKQIRIRVAEKETTITDYLINLAKDDIENK